MKSNLFQVYVEVLYSLQTTWMKGILARYIFEFTISENLTRLRRRWHRWYHAITAMNRMRKFSIDTRSSNTFDMFYIVQNIANNSKVFGGNNFWMFIKLPGRDLVF